MAVPAVQSPTEADVILVKLAREIAMDIGDLQTILKNHSITAKQWETIQTNHRFVELLGSAIEEWEGALNTHGRVKIKAASMIELWLEEANKLLHERGETLSVKIELAKFLARLAEMGLTNAKYEGAGAGDRFSVTINLGADSQLKFEKQVTAKVIDVTPTLEPAH